MDNQKVSILQMVNGAIQERVDYEVKKVIDNILDVNTEAKVKRTIDLKIELKPHDSRQVISVTASAKSKLAPVTPVGTSMVITADGNGEMMIAEVVPQVPGQLNMEGGEQVAPKLLKLAQN